MRPTEVQFCDELLDHVDHSAPPRCEYCGSQLDVDQPDQHTELAASEAILAIAKLHDQDPLMLRILLKVVLHPNASYAVLADGLGVSRQWVGKKLHNIGEQYPSLRSILGVDKPKSQSQRHRRIIEAGEHEPYYTLQDTAKGEQILTPDIQQDLSVGIREAVKSKHSDPVSSVETRRQIRYRIARKHILNRYGKPVTVRRLQQILETHGQPVTGLRHVLAIHQSILADLNLRK
jgi:hypothetical protein